MRKEIKETFDEVHLNKSEKQELLNNIINVENVYSDKKTSFWGLAVTVAAVFIFVFVNILILGVSSKNEKVDYAAEISDTSYSTAETTSEEESGIKVMPVTNPEVTCKYNATYAGVVHDGIDWKSEDLNVYSASDGVVIIAEYFKQEGNSLHIQCADGTIVKYEHLEKIDVTVGENVKAGDVVATMGTTGYSTGVHLHFEVEQNGVSVDPQIWLLN